MAAISTQGKHPTLKLRNGFESLIFIYVLGLCELFVSCKSLKKLSLEHVTVDDKACQALSKNEQLEVLNMSMCYGVGLAGVKSILEGCKKLDSWNLAWTNLSSEVLNLLCTSAPQKLERINISGCRTSLLDERKFIRHQTNIYFLF